MSPYNHEALSRESKPCPFCGQLVSRSAATCQYCKLSLDEKTIRLLDRLMGPWFMLDGKIPSAPGVSWNKFISLIERGKITPTTIVRGPCSHGLWRMAKDTPAVATRLGLCWSCHRPLPPDRNQVHCPHCQANLNGELTWNEVADADSAAAKARGPAPAEEPVDEEVSGAIENLIQSSRPFAAPEPVQRPPARSPAASVVGVMVVLIIVAGACWLGYRIFQEKQRLSAPDSPTVVSPEEDITGSAGRSARTPDADPAGIMKSTPSAPRSSIPDATASRTPGRPSAMPGELFPDVPNGTTIRDTKSGQPVAARNTGVTRTPPTPSVDPLEAARAECVQAWDAAKKAEAAGDLMKAQELLVFTLNKHDKRAWPDGAFDWLKALQDRIRAAPASTPSATGPDEKELANQKMLAEAAYIRAKARIDQNDYDGAQRMLVNMLNNYDRRVWPEGAMETLKTVQAKVATVKPVDEPPPEELARQRSAAAELFRQAQRLVDEGNLRAAQDPLLKILNTYHKKAWPAGTQEALQKVKDAFEKNPSSRPKFFGVEGK